MWTTLWHRALWRILRNVNNISNTSGLCRVFCKKLAFASISSILAQWCHDLGQRAKLQSPAEPPCSEDCQSRNTLINWPPTYIGGSEQATLARDSSKHDIYNPLTSPLRKKRWLSVGYRTALWKAMVQRALVVAYGSFTIRAPATGESFDFDALMQRMTLQDRSHAGRSCTLHQWGTFDALNVACSIVRPS